MAKKSLKDTLLAWRLTENQVDYLISSYNRKYEKLETSPCNLYPELHVPAKMAQNSIIYVCWVEGFDHQTGLPSANPFIASMTPTDFKTAIDHHHFKGKKIEIVHDKTRRTL